MCTFQELEKIEKEIKQDERVLNAKKEVYEKMKIIVIDLYLKLQSTGGENNES